MAIELATPIIGSRLLVGTPVHPSHLPERFGLVTLIVLGEAIVSVATNTADIDWNLIPLLTAIGGFVIAACLWWLYFSFLESVVKIRGIASVHLYNYGHFPILLSLTTVAVGVGHAIKEATHPVLEAGTRWTLGGGIALYMLSIGIIMLTACRRRVSVLAIAVIAVALVLAIYGSNLPPLAFVSMLIVTLVIKVTADILRNPRHQDQPQHIP